MHFALFVHTGKNIFGEKETQLNTVWMCKLSREPARCDLVSNYSNCPHHIKFTVAIRRALRRSRFEFVTISSPVRSNTDQRVVNWAPTMIVTRSPVANRHVFLPP